MADRVGDVLRRLDSLAREAHLSFGMLTFSRAMSDAAVIIREQREEIERKTALLRDAAAVVWNAAISGGRAEGYALHRRIDAALSPTVHEKGER